MLTSSEAEEMLDNDGHIGEEHLGNIIWYVNISVVTKFCSVCTSETFLYRLGALVVIATNVNGKRVCFLPRN